MTFDFSLSVDFNLVRPGFVDETFNLQFVRNDLAADFVLC